MTIIPLWTRHGPKIFLTEVASNVPDRRQSVLVVTATTLVIATVFVVARLVSRIVIVRRTSWDDYFIVIGWVIAFGLSFAAAAGTSKGLGLHDTNIPGEWVYTLRKYEYTFAVLYNPALMATKSSMIIFYLRLSRNTHKLLRIASWITLGVTNIAGLILTFFNVFQCIPVSQVFDPAGKCIPLIELYLASAPVNVITDIAVLVLPIPVLTRMQLPRKQKTILVATFGLGLYVIATDIIRIYYLQQSSSGAWGVSSEATSPLLGNQVDFAWHASLSFMWSAVEVNVGIICACVPTLKPLIGKLLPTLIDNRRWSSCFWASNKSATAATDANGNIPSPISPPQPVFTTNSVTLVASHGRFSSNATDTMRSFPSIVEDATQDAEIQMLDFVTSPGMDPQTIPRASSAISRTETHVYFGFFSIRSPKSMLGTSIKDSIKYCTMVTILFFLCGLSHGLWNNLNNQISKISSNNMARTLSLYSVYYGAYLLGPWTIGQYVLRRGGFKTTFITGLCIYGTGTFMFWPSSVLLSLPGFLVSNFFVGFGLSIIETATNPFLALCGPAYYGEIRLLIARGIQAVGKVVGMLIADKGLFQNVQVGPALLDIQWIYLSFALLSVVFALIFYYLPLPEATDDDLHQDRQPGLPQLNYTIFPQPEQRVRIVNCRVIFMTLSLGFVAQFLSSGTNLGNGVWFSSTLASASQEKPTFTSFNCLLLADSSGAVGQFIFAALCLFAPPRILLLLSFLGAILFSALIFALTSLNRNSMAALIIVLYFFEGPIWPLIFAISLRGMGRETKLAAGVLTTAQGGAAVVPWLMYAVIKDGRTAQYSYCLLLAFLVIGTLFPIYLSAFSPARQQVDRGEKHVAFGNREWPRSRGNSNDGNPVQSIGIMNGTR